VPGLEGDAFAGEGEELELRGLDIGEERDAPQEIDFFLDAHARSLREVDRLTVILIE
jgi:hypothetical protein